jgi:hypothetical protein
VTFSILKMTKMVLRETKARYRLRLPVPAIPANPRKQPQWTLRIQVSPGSAGVQNQVSFRTHRHGNWSKRLPTKSLDLQNEDPV